MCLTNCLTKKGKMVREFFESMMLKRFWRTWEYRLTNNNNNYINPDDPSVKRYAKQFDVDHIDDPAEIARVVWEHINDEYEYELTEEWQTPRELMKEGIGDCEDYVFLTASVLPHLGVNEFTVVAGEAKLTDEAELHAWMEVNGELIDPTANLGETDHISYEPELEFDIKIPS